jgi:predicted metalloprotease with PDZ domain
VLVSPYAENYFNVYQKGALIGMCIDILMREESNGNRGILSLMKELSLKYGKNRPFDDEKLFEEIIKMTYPSIGEFFETHVVGNTPIDYNTFFERVGLEKKETQVETNYIQNNGALIVSPSADGTIRFNQLVSDNSFWNEQGVLPGDVIYEVNGTVVTMQNANQVFTEVFLWKPGNEIKVKLKREGEEVVIDAELTPSYTTGVQLISKEDVTEEQLELRSAWMKG